MIQKQQEKFEKMEEQRNKKIQDYYKGLEAIGGKMTEAQEKQLAEHNAKW